MTAAQQNQAALAKRPSDTIVGSFVKPDAITDRLRAANERCHLISPSTSVGTLPQGFEVAISMVQLDVENETYSQSGKRALSKVALDKIAAAAGVSWDPVQSGRVDDGSDPHYCSFRAVGIVKDFDGTRRVLAKTKEMDLRDGSAATEDIWISAKSDAEGEKQLRQVRKHIVAHAESKAQCRVMRALGVRSTYSKEELEKPFAVARLMFTGRTEDPALRDAFARMIAEDALGGGRLLFGPTPALPVVAAPRLAAPPPVGTTTDDEDELPEPIQAKPIAAKVQERPAQSTREARPATIPGKARGDARRPVADAETKDLEYWLGRMESELASGRVDERYREDNARTCDAISVELKKRRGDATDDERDPFAEDDEFGGDLPEFR